VKRRPTYLEAGQRMRFGRPVQKRIERVDPAPDPASVADFDLGTWRVRPASGRLTRADRLVALDPATLRCLLVLHEAPPGGVARPVLAARVFGMGAPEEKLRRCLSHLRRVFAEDGSVRIENAAGDCFVLWTGPPVPGRHLRGGDGQQLAEPIQAVSTWIERPRNRLGAVAASAALVGLLVFGLIRMLGSPPPTLSHTVRGVRPFAVEPGVKTSPSFAPDGRQVVYAWAQPGEVRAHLYVRAVTGGAPRPLTSGDGDDRFPVWSTGGGLIGFARLHDGACDLMTVLADGTNLRKVGTCAAGVIGPMTFSREGRALTYPNRTADDLPSQIVTVDLNTGALSGVTNPLTGMPGDSRPTLTANSRRLAFVRTRSAGVADILIVERAAGESSRLTHDSAEIRGMAWEPGGRTLLVASTRSGPSRLWAIPGDGSDPRFVLGGPGELGGLTLSPDAHEVVVERLRRTTRLAMVPLDPAAAPRATADGVAADREPALSPDGRRLVFVSDRSGSDELWLADGDGSRPRQLTHERADWLGEPRWSADGTLIVVAAGQRGDSDLFAIDAASGARRALTADHRSAHPSFSRDGRYLYYSTRATAGAMPQIVRRRWPQFGPTETVTTAGGTAAAESADGKRLYYTRPDRGGLWSRSPGPGDDDTLVAPEFAASDRSDWVVVPGGVLFVMRPAGAAQPAMLARYAEDAESVSRVRDLPGLAPDAGLALAGDGSGLWYAQQTNLTVDLELVALD
jgi:Tol biopolymer transport system component